MEHRSSPVPLTDLLTLPLRRLRPGLPRRQGHSRLYQGVHDRVAHSYRSGEGIIGRKTEIALDSLADHWPTTGKDPLRVLDLGVGDGDLLHRLRQRDLGAIAPTGVDVSSAMLDKARLRLPDMTPVHCSACQASAHLPAASFDLAFAHFILAYVTLPDVLREAGRLLAPGGLLSLATSTNRLADPLRAHIAAMERSLNFRKRVAAYGTRRGLAFSNTPESWEAMLPAFDAAGLTVVDRRWQDFDIRFDTVEEAYAFCITDGWCANALRHPILPPEVMARMVRWGLGAFPHPFVATHRIEVCLLRRS